MKKYNLLVQETLSREVEIVATSEEEALKILEEMYHNEEIVLSSEDYSGTDFEILESEEV